MTTMASRYVNLDGTFANGHIAISQKPSSNEDLDYLISSVVNGDYDINDLSIK